MLDRKSFIKACCWASISLPVAATLLEACGTIHYAAVTQSGGKWVVPKSEFLVKKKNGTSTRKFVLVNTQLGFPICLYKVTDEGYIAALMKCTHRGCELNVGGGIYSCPCHGSEFSIEGQVLEGPADQDLKTYQTSTDHDNIYISQA